MIGPWRDPISGRWIVEKPPLIEVPERVLENSERALIESTTTVPRWITSSSMPDRAAA